MNEVRKIDKNFQTLKLQEEIEFDLNKQKAVIKRGHLPNYLVKFKKEAAEE